MTSTVLRLVIGNCLSLNSLTDGFAKAAEAKSATSAAVMIAVIFFILQQLRFFSLWGTL